MINPVPESMVSDPIFRFHRKQCPNQRKNRINPNIFENNQFNRDKKCTIAALQQPWKMRGGLDRFPGRSVAERETWICILKDAKKTETGILVNRPIISLLHNIRGRHPKEMHISVTLSAQAHKE